MTEENIKFKRMNTLLVPVSINVLSFIVQYVKRRT
jgi:hypothetical protein